MTRASLYAGSRVCANRGNVSLRTLIGQKGSSLYEPRSDRKGRSEGLIPNPELICTEGCVRHPEAQVKNNC